MGATDVRLAHPAPLEPPPRPSRPAGRLLRAIVGVDEDLMDAVPEERPRYTRQGALLVATAIMAAVSMGYALFDVFAAHWLVIVGIAVLWGGLIGVLDSWLVISANGVIGRGRKRLLLPRLLIALVFGMVIAEPLTIRVFEGAIVERIKLDQQAADSRLLTSYQSCLQKADKSGCPSLPVAPPVSALTAKRQELAELKRTIASPESDWRDIRTAAQNECAGEEGRGFSGRQGYGELCIALRKEAREFKQSSGLVSLYAQRARLTREIAVLTDTDKKADATYAEQYTEAAKAEVARQQATRPDRPDLLQKMGTLATLSSEKIAVLLGHLFLTLLFLLIDCSPVLTKLLSRATAYDHRLAETLNDRSDAHELKLRGSRGRRRKLYDEQAHREDLRTLQNMRDASREAGIEERRRERVARHRMGGEPES